MLNTLFRLALLASASFLPVAHAAADNSAAQDAQHCASGVCIEDLNALSVDQLRRETWHGLLDVQGLAPAIDPGTSKTGRHGRSTAGKSTPPAVLLSLVSDGLRQYARLDMPTAQPPPHGYPLVIFIHGWIGREAAPHYVFGARPGSMYRDLVSRLTEAGFAVMSPGLRGHGTVDGVPAQGIEFLEAWDNGSYLSPTFYARDVLNLLSTLPDLNQRLGSDHRTVMLPYIDTSGVAMLAHSQGGDVLLTVLSIAGANSRIRTPVLAASIWAGNIADRFTQAETFGPMGSTLQAFMAGDGQWTGTATGVDGSVNRDFVFPWPPHWIETVDRDSARWSWQEDTWSTPTVRGALEQKYGEMYDTINRYVENIDDARFSISRDGGGQLRVSNDPRVAAIMPRIGGYNQERHLVQALNLHFSDRDYYSLPGWNRSLARRIQARGGRASAYEYLGTTHSLAVSEHTWYSPPGTRDGVTIAIGRDIALFRSAMRSDPDPDPDPGPDQH